MKGGDAIGPLVIYGIGSLLKSAITFLLIPIYLSCFSPEEYGVIAILLVTENLTTLTLGAGILPVLSRLYYERTLEDRKSLVGTVVLWILFVGILGVVVFQIVASYLSSFLLADPSFIYSFKLMGFCIVFTMLRQIPSTILRLEKKAFQFVVLAILELFVDFVLKVFLIVYLARSVGGYFEATIVSGVLVTLFASQFLTPYVKLRFEISSILELLRLGSPYILSGLAAWTLNYSDRYVIEYYEGVESVGIYALAFAIASIFTVVISNPVALLLDPLIFSELSKNESRLQSLNQRTLSYSVYAGVGCYLLLVLCCHDGLMLISYVINIHPDYIEATKLVPILTLVPLLYFLSNPPGITLLWIRRPIYISLTLAVASIINFILNLILVKEFGIVGASVSSAIVYLLQGVVLYIVASRYVIVKYPWKEITKALVLALSIYLLSSYISLAPVSSIVTKILLVVSVHYVGIWKYTELLSREDKRVLVGGLFGNKKNAGLL